MDTKYLVTLEFRFTSVHKNKIDTTTIIKQLL